MFYWWTSIARKVVIVGAGGRDFHNFNVVFKDNPSYRVVAFVVTQIPGIEFRRYPPTLAGPQYPDGIPIYPLKLLPKVVSDFNVDEVVLSLSDLTYDEVGKIMSMTLALGCDFRVLGYRETMLSSVKPVLAVTAVKTGAGKSTVSRAFVEEFMRRGIKVVVVRHPMAYGDLERNSVQVFKSLDDLSRYELTIEEIEEFEPHLRMGATVLAGVDYGRVLREAEGLGDVIIWDGGNNDIPFYRPWYWVVVADAMRPGIEVSSYPGEVNVRLANAVIVNKVSQSRREDIDKVIANIRGINKDAHIIKADMEVEVDNPNLISGKRVVVIEDHPTVTHGGLPYAAGYVAAMKYGAEPIDPRPYAVGYIRKVYEEYPHIGPVLPSTGYSLTQLRDLKETIEGINVDAVVIATPADIAKIIKLSKPVVRVYWKLKVIEGPSVSDLVDEFMDRVNTLRT